MGSPQESYRDIDRYHFWSFKAIAYGNLRLYRRRKLSAEFLRLSSVDSNSIPDRPREEDTTVGVVTVFSALDEVEFPKGSSVKLSISGSTSSQEVRGKERPFMESCLGGLPRFGTAGENGCPAERHNGNCNAREGFILLSSRHWNQGTPVEGWLPAAQTTEPMVERKALHTFTGWSSFCDKCRERKCRLDTWHNTAPWSSSCAFCWIMNLKKSATFII